MKRILFVLVLSALCLVTISAVPQTKTWEYKTTYGKCAEEKKLNALGAEGWEMTGYASSYLSAGAGSVDTCIFKRLH